MQRQTKWLFFIKANKVLANCAECKNRICLVRQVVTWQSDHSMLKMLFNNGVTGQLTGQENPGLCLLTMLSIDGLLGNASIERSFAKLLWLSLSLKKLLTEYLHTIFTLEDLTKKIKVYLYLFRQMVGIHHERSSLCGLWITKFHGLLYFDLQIEKFGSSHNFIGG